MKKRPSPAARRIQQASPGHRSRRRRLAHEPLEPRVVLAAFLPNHLAVLQTGDGNTTLGANAAQVSIAEYALSGQFVQSVPLPTTTVGNQNALVLNGTGTSDGLITRSVDQRYLLVTGYKAAVGTSGLISSAATTYPRTVGRIDAAGSVDTSTALTDFADIGNPRSVASTDGHDLWLGGGLAGSLGDVRYTTLGATTSTPIASVTGSLRQLAIVDNRLMISMGQTSVTLATVGSGLPTTPGQTVTSLSGISSTNLPSPYQFVALDRDETIPGVDVLYVANDQSGDGIRKFFNNGGSWVAAGSVTKTNEQFRGLTGYVSGNDVVLFATTPKGLYTVVDTADRAANMSGTLTLLAVAPDKTSFRGITFTPQAANAPPQLTLSGDAATYIATQSPLLIAPGATVTDADSANFSGGTLTVSNAGGEATDELAIHDEGTAVGEIGVDGNQLTFGSSVIGTFTGGAGTTPLVIQFTTAAATPDAVQAVVRNLTFRSTAPTPATTDRALELSLTDGAGGASSPATQTVHVALPVGISISAASIVEGNTASTTLEFLVTLSTAPLAPVIVTYATADATATVADNDYLPRANDTLTFLPGGALTQIIPVTVFGDVTHEPNEQLLMNLSGVTGPGVLIVAQAIGTIVNDDPLPQISIGNRTQAEGNAGSSAFEFPLTLSHPSSQAITVRANTADASATVLNNDYAPLVNELITFAPGETTATLAVNVTGDLFFEEDEQFLVELSVPTNAEILNAQAIGTITNDDEFPRLSINSVEQVEGHSGATPLIFTVSLSAATQQPVTVEYATADDTATASDNDYTPIVTAQTLTFLPGEPLTQTIAIDVHGDNKYEATQQFFVNLTNATDAELAVSQGVGTIVNDDPLPTVSIEPAEAAEGDSGLSPLVFTVTLSHPSEQAITVNYATADDAATTADNDYLAAANTLTFAANATELTQTVTVSVVGDTKFEPTETFVVELAITNAANATAQALGTIINDDPSPDLVISAGSAPGNGVNNQLADDVRVVLSPDGEALDIYVAGQLAQSRLLASMQSLTVQGSSDLDTLTLDYSQGDWTLPGGIAFDANAFGLGAAGDNDTLVIRGSSGDDQIRVLQDAGVLRVSLNGSETLVVLTGAEGTLSVEQVRIEAGNGQDRVELNWRDHDGVHLGVDADLHNAVRYHVHGGDDALTDTLVMIDDGLDDLTIVRQQADQVSGVVTIGPANSEPLVATFTAMENVQFFTTRDDGTVPVPPVAPNTAETNSRLVVLPYDFAEPNHDRLTATPLFANSTHIGVIATGGDADWFRIDAAVTGTLDLQLLFAQLATIPGSSRPGLPSAGDLSLELYSDQGALLVPPLGFGANDADDDERIRIPTVQGQTYYLRVFGATSEAVNRYTVVATNLEPPTPYDVQLSDASSATNNATPTLHVRLDDSILLNDLPGEPPDERIPIPFQTAAVPGYRVAIFLDDEQLPRGYAEATSTDGLYAYTLPVPLADGAHTASARVELIDPTTAAAFGPRSSLAMFRIDTTPPTIAWGAADNATDGLGPGSDSGVSGVAGTFTDRITSVTAPTLWGTAEPGSQVRVYADLDANQIVGPADPLLATAIADATGQWEATALLPLDAELFGSSAGLRQLLVTAEDDLGNMSAPQPFALFLDPQPPVITEVFVSDAPQYELFAPHSITPLIHSLALRVVDGPARASEFLFAALATGIATSPGHFQLNGDFHGLMAIDSITFTPEPPVAGSPAAGIITLGFNAPLPDDRFTLTISDALVDAAGNHLDGETNAQQPIAGAQFPSGDGAPGGAFVARFTVDSRAEIATWSGQTAWVDANGNGLFDPAAAPDFMHRDLVYQLSAAPLAMFTGNFALFANATADGFDKLAGYYEHAGQQVFLIDVDHDGVPDNEPGLFPPVAEELTVLNLSGQPIAGRFDDSDVNGDEVGLFDGTTFYFDTNHNFVLDDADAVLVSELRGQAVVGDFDGDGFDDLAAWQDEVVAIDLANGAQRGWDGVADFVVRLTLAGVSDRVLAADVDGDGIDDLGLWSPELIQTSPENRAQWMFIVSGGLPLVKPGLAAGDAGHRVAVSPLDGAASFQFTPVPFGSDLSFDWGDIAAQPLVGNFDPPAVQNAASLTGKITNERNPLDVDNDGVITATDAVLLVNIINAGGPRLLTSSARTASGPYLDVDGDHFLTAADAVVVTNYINAGGGVGAIGEGEPALAEPTWNTPLAYAAWSSNSDALLATASSPDATRAHDQSLSDFFAAWPERVFLPQMLPREQALPHWDLRLSRVDDDMAVALAELFDEGLLGH